MSPNAHDFDLVSSAPRTRRRPCPPASSPSSSSAAGSSRAASRGAFTITLTCVLWGGLVGGPGARAQGAGAADVVGYASVRTGEERVPVRGGSFGERPAVSTSWLPRSLERVPCTVESHSRSSACAARCHKSHRHFAPRALLPSRHRWLAGDGWDRVHSDAPRLHVALVLFPVSPDTHSPLSLDPSRLPRAHPRLKRHPNTHDGLGPELPWRHRVLGWLALAAPAPGPSIFKPDG